MKRKPQNEEKKEERKHIETRSIRQRKGKGKGSLLVRVEEKGLKIEEQAVKCVFLFSCMLKVWKMGVGGGG